MLISYKSVAKHSGLHKYRYISQLTFTPLIFKLGTYGWHTPEFYFAYLGCQYACMCQPLSSDLYNKPRITGLTSCTIFG